MRRKRKEWRVAAAVLMAAQAALAGSGTWNTDAASTWSDTAKWSGGTVADGAAQTASFSANLTAARTVTLDSARTIGGLSFADTASPYYAWTISGANTLTLDADGAGGGASIISVAGSSTAVIGGGLELAGGSALSKQGNGTLTLTGSHTYSGQTSVLAGTLLVGSAAPSGSVGALGNATSAIVLGGTSGTSNVMLGTAAHVANLTVARDIVVQAGNTGTVTIAHGGNSDGKAYTYSGSITLGSGGAAHGLTLGAGTSGYSSTVTNEFTGVIQDPVGLSGPGGVLTVNGTTAGSGGYTYLVATKLSGANTFSGGVNLVGGTLALSNAQALGTGALTINGTGTTRTSISTTAAGATQSNNNALNLKGDLYLSNGDLNLGTGAVTLYGNCIIDVRGGGVTTNNTLTLGGVIAETGTGNHFGITYSGGYGVNNYTNTLLLTGANTFSGGLTIGAIGSRGVLKIGNLGTTSAASAIGTGTFTIGAGATFDNASGSDGTLSTNNAQTWNGSFTFKGTNSLNMGNGAVSLGTAAGTTRTVTVAANTLAIGGVISNGNTATGIEKAGPGTLTLAGANTYTGDTTVSGGSLKLAHGLALQNSTLASGGVVFDASVATHAFTFGGLKGSGSLSLQDNAATANAVALTVGGNGQSTTYTGVLSGSGSLRKVGIGTLTLGSGSNYTGGTTIAAGGIVAANSTALGSGSVSLDGGTLVVNSGVTLTNPVSFGAGGGKIAGNGAISSPIVLGMGATLAPGASSGILTTGAQTWAGGGVYEWEINDAAGAAGDPGHGFDFISGTGALDTAADSGSTFTIKLIGLDSGNVAGAVQNFDNTATYAWTIATFAGGISNYELGRFTLDSSGFVDHNSLGANGLLSLELTEDGKSLQVVYSIPEPTAIAVGMGMLSVAAMLRRRRN